MKTLFKYLFVFVAAVLLAVIARYYFLETYLVQSISMNNTLVEGDKLMITKTKKFRFGDILVFYHNQETYVKRVLGLPGDTVQIINGALYINHRKQSEEYLNPKKSTAETKRVDPTIMNYYGKNWTLEDFGPYIVPRHGNRVILDTNNMAVYGALLSADRAGLMTTRINNQVYTFKKDYYFMLGDNRLFSEDSRTYGPIASAAIIGRAQYILFSENNIWSRFFKKI